MNTCESNPKIAAWADSLGILAASTNVAHIFPSSTSKGITTADGGDSKV